VLVSAFLSPLGLLGISRNLFVLLLFSSLVKMGIQSALMSLIWFLQTGQEAEFFFFSIH
jgi:hypothetical protein